MCVCVCLCDVQTYINQARVVTLSEIVQYASFIEVRQAGHVLNLLKLRWVHLLCVVDVNFNLLQGKQIFCKVVKKASYLLLILTLPSTSSSTTLSAFCFFTQADLKASSSSGIHSHFFESNIFVCSISCRLSCLRRYILGSVSDIFCQLASTSSLHNCTAVMVAMHYKFKLVYLCFLFSHKQRWRRTTKIHNVVW